MLYPIRCHVRRIKARQEIRRRSHKMTELNRRGQTAVHRVSPRAPQGPLDAVRWVRERIQVLPYRLGGRPSELPLGVRVVVLKGEVRNDIGQMAIVSRIAGSQVEISYRGPAGRLLTRRKNLSSLIRLEEGLELMMNEDGWPIIRRMIEEDADEENSVGVVSADGEVYAQ
jgi:hypothetical protein